MGSSHKQKPKARLRFIRKGVAYYYADLKEQTVNFEVPVDDMGDADFNVEVEGKLLIRWISDSSKQ